MILKTVLQETSWLNLFIILYMHLFLIQYKWLTIVLEKLEAAVKTRWLFPRGFEVQWEVKRRKGFAIL